MIDVLDDDFVRDYLKVPSGFLRTERKGIVPKGVHYRMQCGCNCENRNFKFLFQPIEEFKPIPIVELERIQLNEVAQEEQIRFSVLAGIVFIGRCHKCGTVYWFQESPT